MIWTTFETPLNLQWRLRQLVSYRSYTVDVLLIRRQQWISDFCFQEKKPHRSVSSLQITSSPWNWDTEVKDEISYLQKTFEANSYPSRLVHWRTTQAQTISCSNYIDGKERNGKNPNCILYQGIRWKDRMSEQAIEHQSGLSNPDHYTTESYEGEKEAWYRGNERCTMQGCLWMWCCMHGQNRTQPSHNITRTRMCCLFNRGSKNNIASHVMEKDHKLQWEETQVIASELQLAKHYAGLKQSGPKYYCTRRRKV